MPTGPLGEGSGIDAARALVEAGAEVALRLHDVAGPTEMAAA